MSLVNDYLKSTTSAQAPQKQGVGNFFNSLTSSLEPVNKFATALSPTLNTLNAAGNIIGGITGFFNARKAYKQQKKYLNMLENQFNTENARYEQEKAQKDQANAEINNTAALFRVWKW